MHELTRIALVGTSKHAAAGVADDTHPAEALLADLAEQDREHLFLLRAGSRAVFEQCGRLPRSGVEPGQPCSAEDRPFAPQGFVGPLQNAMATDSWDLLVEFLRELDAVELSFPPDLLPQALSISDTKVREHLLPVLGRRGRWLSRFNPQWRWVTEGIGQLSSQDRDALTGQWEAGSVAERCHALQAMRLSDPAEARDRLADVFDKEKADHRARLLGTFETGLSADDEPLLESWLDDRSEQVRRKAAGLLARLPESALASRMQQRAEAILTAESSGISRKEFKLVCRPPEAIDKTWERDGVPKKAPAGRGKRAVWTETVLSAVPPSRWSRRFESEPSALIDSILEDDFAQPVLVGWTRAAATFAALEADGAAWLRPLWDHWLAVQQRTRGDKGRRAVLDHLRLLLRSMPDAEAAMEPVLESAVSDADTELLGLLALVPRPWSEPFGRRYLSTVRGVLERQTERAYHWAQTLFTAGRALPRATFDEALEPWSSAGAESGNWHGQAVAREIGKFTEAIRARKSFHDEIASVR